MSPVATGRHEALLHVSANPADALPGTLRVDRHRVVFEGAGRQVEIPFADLELRVGGARDDTYFLSSRAAPADCVSTTDASLLDEPALRAVPAVARQVGGVRRHHAVGRLVVGAGLVALGLLVAAVILLVARRDALVAWVAAKVPPELEVQVGDALFEGLAAEAPLLTDPAVQSALESLVEPLLAAAPDAGYPFRFHVLRDDSLNAFALPGGNVVLHSALVAEADDADEVLGVLAHELAHVTERHTLRQLIANAGLVVLAQLVLGDLSGLGEIAAEGGLQLATLQFSREFEREADDVGWATLERAGVDPNGLIAVFERFAAEADAAGGLEAKFAFLSTHPTSRERIENLEDKRDDLPVAATWLELDDELSALQDALAAAEP